MLCSRALRASHFPTQVFGEQPAHLLHAVRLAQGPHQLGHRRLGGHVPALDHPLGQRLLPRLIKGEVAALVQALGTHHHRHPRLGRSVELLDEVAADEVQPSRPERFDDHPAVVHPQQHVEDLRVQPGSELDEKHLLAQLPVQHTWPLDPGDGLLPDGEARAVHHRHGGPVHAVEGSKVGGVGLDRPAAQHHPAPEGQKHPRPPRRRHGKGGAQVVQPVGEGVLNGQLGPGEHHRDGYAPHHEGQHRGGVGHGVGAVGDDDAVKFVPGVKDVPGDEPPLLGLDVGRVQVEDIPHGERVAVRQRPQAAGQGVAVQPWGQPLVGDPGGDGAPGGEQ